MADTTHSITGTEADNTFDDTSFGPLPQLTTPPNLKRLALKRSTSSLSSIKYSPDVVYRAIIYQAEKDKIPITTVALDMAKRNLVQASLLNSRMKYDVVERPPLFVTGVLQLPGSLGTVLGYQRRSEMELAECMTPGRTLSPLAVDSQDGAVACSRMENSVAGMVILGRGRRNRRQIDEWYGKRFARVLVDVQIHVQQWGVKKQFKAYTWVEKSALGCEDSASTSEESEDDSCIGPSDSDSSVPEGIPIEKWWKISPDLRDCIDCLGDGHDEGHDWRGKDHNTDVVW
ncbi:hypothetical protein CAC42_6027 [Sphaceloma murrayae]|uniref:Uncharacterized protein n=1 Tax=Sphaceloma murrayae TaxID=2082308 RepID=A0A2K1QV56_9PEZI|nr:hypothetical protein CAC42_6027 [Sphaceloma murrayae]